MDDYCVYLTCYLGNKLPPFYIGSTTITKIESGYKGSIKSKQYKEIFQNEKLNNSHLFKTKIIKIFKDRKEALAYECFIQTKLNVVKSSLYMNKSIAKDFGWFGMDTKGVNSPVFGKKWKLTIHNRQNISNAQKKKWKDVEYVKKISELRKNKYHRPKDVVKFVSERRKQIISLYRRRPEIDHGYICKNGKVMTYEQAFSKTYSSHFGITPQAIKSIISCLVN